MVFLTKHFIIEHRVLCLSFSLVDKQVNTFYEKCQSRKQPEFSYKTDRNSLITKQRLTFVNKQRNCLSMGLSLSHKETDKVSVNEHFLPKQFTDCDHTVNIA